MAKKTKELTLEEKLEQALVPADEQPYEIPENWYWTYLGLVADWGSGGTPSRKKTEYYGGDIPWIKTGELNDGYIYDSEEKITEEAVKKSSAKLFPKDTIAIAMYGATIGKVGIFGIDATTNQACACAKCKPLLDYKYLFYYSRSQKDAFIEKGKGGAQPNISQEIIKKHVIPLPPLAEQQRIVDRIESLFAKLDEAKDILQNLIFESKQRKTSLLHKAFSGELTEEWRKERGVDKVEIVMPLSAVCEKITDGTHNSPVNTPEGEFMYVTAKNIKESGVVLNNITYVSKEVHEEIYNRCDVKYGDVLYIKDGATAGIATVNNIKEEFSLLSSVAVLRPKKDTLRAKYLVYNLNFSETKEKMLSNLSGSAITRLTLVKIKNAEIKVCSIDEQDEIIALLDNCLEKEEVIIEKIEQTMNDVEVMKKSILVKAFRGELGTNDTADEDAIELLKEVIG